MFVEYLFDWMRSFLCLTWCLSETSIYCANFYNSKKLAKSILQILGIKTQNAFFSSLKALNYLPRKAEADTFNQNGYVMSKYVWNKGGTSPPKGDQSWVFIGRTDAEAETPVLWPPHAKSWLTGKDPDVGRDWGQEEKETTEDEMAGWHHRLDGHEFE